MLGRIEDKANYVVDHSDFPKLPKDEHDRILRYVREAQIRTLLEVLKRNKQFTTDKWRKLTRLWLGELVGRYEREYMED